MSTINNPGDDKEIANRFRRLLDTSEDKDSKSKEPEEPISGETQPHELSEEVDDNTEPIDQSIVVDQASNTSTVPNIDSEKENTSIELPSEPIVPESVEGSNNQAILPTIADTSAQKVMPAIDEYGMPLPGRTIKISSQHTTTNPITTNKQQS
jgi:hypothetical protein